ncbi:MAG: PqqD family protein [Acholeplasma sp.]
MKIKKEYILKSVAGQHIVVPIGREAVKFHGMITLNDTGKFLFESLKEPASIEQLVNKVMDAYEVDLKTARKDVEMFVDLLIKNEIIEN